MNNFNNILTKTERLRTLQRGIENSQRGGGGGRICWTLASYKLLRFLQEKIAKFHRKKEGAISSDHRVQRRCVQNPSKTSEKMSYFDRVFRYTFYRPQPKRLRARKPCASEDIACDY